MWRAGCFAAGLPVGALAGVAFAEPGVTPAALGALAGAALLLLIGSLLGSRGPAGRGPRVAAATQTGWLALPAVAAAWLELAPGPLPFLALAVVVVAMALAGASRGRAPGSPLHTALVSLLAGLVLAPCLALALAAAGASTPALGEGTAAAIFDLDARVVTRPLPRCRSAPAAVEVLLEHGSHPRLAAAGSWLFFEAAAQDGRRQVQRMSTAGGEPECLTCQEPGNNRRPAPGRDGRVVVFDTDRWADHDAPANTELQHLRVMGEGAPHPSRRLTFERTRDDHVVLSPSGASLLWSRQAGGRFTVASAGFRRGHGALLLSAPRVVAVGGAAWTAPVAWSSDARALAVASGNPLGLLSARLLDPATGALSELATALSGAGGVDFSADGGRVAVAESEGAAGLGALPAGVGVLLGALPPDRLAADPRGGTRLRIGDTGGELTAVELGEAGSWGAPAGVAYGPGGTWLVLGQRRKQDGTVRERLVRVTLDCSLP
jgi:hypothetical protein